MRDRLRSGNVSSLRSNSFIFSRNVRLDRLTLAAGHDLTGTGRLRRDDNAAVGRIDGPASSASATAGRRINCIHRGIRMDRRDHSAPAARVTEFDRHGRIVAVRKGKDDHWEIDFCSVQEVTSFLQAIGAVLKMKISALRDLNRLKSRSITK